MRTNDIGSIKSAEPAARDDTEPEKIEGEINDDRKEADQPEEINQ